MKAFHRFSLLSVTGLVLAAHSSLAQETDAVSDTSPYAWHHDAAARAELRERLMTRLNEELELSIEQQAVMADILRDYGPRMAALMKRGVEIGWSVMDAAQENPQYAIDTEATAQAAAEAAAEWVRTVTEMRNAVFSILTQGQIATIQARVEERREAWQQRVNGSDEEASPSGPD